MKDSPVAKRYPRMMHDDWVSYIGIITADGKKKLAKTRKQRLARQEKAKGERHDKRAARAAKVVTEDADENADENADDDAPADDENENEDDNAPATEDVDDEIARTMAKLASFFLPSAVMIPI